MFHGERYGAPEVGAEAMCAALDHENIYLAQVLAQLSDVQLKRIRDAAELLYSCTGRALEVSTGIG